MYKKPCKILYHVFSNGVDEYVESLKKAVSIAKQWRRDYGCVRIYKQTEWNSKDGIFEDGDCILSFGGFPF